MPDKKNQFASPRRSFLKSVSAMGLAAGSSALTGTIVSTALTGQAFAAPLAELDPMASRRIRLVNAHTWEKLNVVYFTHGIYIDENIQQLNHLMRDRRANASIDMDTALFDQLLRVQMALGTEEPVHVLSGYRTPETNAKLRRRSPGVAKFSLHMEGRAADIYIPGVPIEKLHQAAMDMQAGGVGLYSNSNFVHVDTGSVRHWGS
ncbi:YcbK family protein [Granulosicoccus sp. 3-233]|uniref:YcbK family protein n=1 Tax=Granulosicoccus sp. 3-233 TaxID=3417969 RepID=UPI003D32A7CD